MYYQNTNIVQDAQEVYKSVLQKTVRTHPGCYGHIFLGVQFRSKSTKGHVELHDVVQLGSAGQTRCDFLDHIVSVHVELQTVDGRVWGLMDEFMVQRSAATLNSLNP